MARFKKWNPGVADDAWKVAIAARDAHDADSALLYLAYVLLDGPQPTTSDEAAQRLRGLSGDDIATGLLRYRDGAVASIRSGMRPSKED